MSAQRCEVLVVGGGPIGLAVARALAHAEIDVVVLDPDPGRGAAFAAAGILSPTDPHEWVGPLGHFNIAAIDLWTAWAADLEAESGIAIRDQRGELRIGMADSAFLSATRDGCKRAGWDVVSLDPTAATTLHTGLELPDDSQVLHLPMTAAVNVDLMTAALRISLRDLGVQIRPERAISSDLARRIIQTDQSGWMFDRVVSASGWTSDWLPRAERVPLKPMLGEAIIVHAAGHEHPSIPVRSSAGSIVPRSDGTVWLGTTVLDRDAENWPSAGSVSAILSRALTLWPSLSDARFAEARSGLRPMSPDHMPVIGPRGDVLVLAMGHGREGIIQAPLTAELLRRGLVSERWDGVPAAFSPTRPLIQ